MIKYLIMWAYSIARHPSSVHPLTFLTIFTAKTIEPFEAKFIVKLPCGGGGVLCSGALGHKTKMATIPYMKTKSDTFLYRTIWSTAWYLALETQKHRSLFTVCLWVDLVHFYAKVKFGRLSFRTEKLKLFLETFETVIS